MAQSVLLSRSVALIGSSPASKICASDAGLRVQPACARQLSSLGGLEPLPIAPQIRHLAPGAVKTFALFGSKSDTKGKSSGKKAIANKPKKVVEDGIFGTSGGIGFTKQNELFVGRVAMLGFAAGLLGEAITGKGVLAQFDFETGIPLNKTEPLLLFFILFTLLGAIGALGDRGKFVDEEDVTPATGLDRAVIPPGKGVKSALGLNEKGPVFGFTKSNELFVGRLAQLGIAFSIIGEIITGKGTLAQLNIETGVPITEIEPIILFNVLFFFFAAINPGNGKFINDEELENE